jgi:tetratricopeptide (TPR) repeat protein
MEPAIAANRPEPRLFEVPHAFLPLKQPEVERGPAVPQSVQAQYAQSAGPVAAAQAPQPRPDSPVSIYVPQPEVQPPASLLAAGERRPEPMASPRGARSTLAQQMQAVIERTTQMARKGMIYAAKEELVKALDVVAQTRDAEQGTVWRGAALSAGLTALKEAEEFSSSAAAGSTLRASDLVHSHRTTILKGAGDLSPAVAQQYYLGYAQQQLTLAVAGEPAASQILYMLGKAHMALASASSAPPLHSARAIVCHQAALAIDARNYQAANELGVLLAQTGQLAEARRALLHSVTIHPHVEGWHNLAAVHRRLGENELARLADEERQRLVAQGAPAMTASQSQVKWVDARTFASSTREAYDASASRTATAPDASSHHR